MCIPIVPIIYEYAPTRIGIAKYVERFQSKTK